MKFIFSIVVMPLLLAFSHVDKTPKAGEDDLTLFDFELQNDKAWQVVNDGVMGGRSKGYVEIKNGHLEFKGKLVTRGGGFTSLRTKREIDLSAFEGLELRVRGGGRSFEIEVDDGTRRGWRSVSRRASFETEADWTLVRIPFTSLGTTIFGRRVSAPKIDLELVEQFGLYIADGIDGPFDLQVDYIKAYKD